MEIKMEKKVITIEDANTGKKDLDGSKPIDEQLYQAGKYEVTNEHTFKIEFFLQVKKDRNDKERWIVLDNKVEDSELHWAEFRMWNYEEEIELRKFATTYDPLKRMHFVDHDVLNRLKIQRLLLAWSFEKDNLRLKLHHVQGVLTDDCYKMFMKLFPNIVKRIVEGMNNILDFNG